MGWWWIVIGVVSFLAGLTVWAWKEELAFQILLLRHDAHRHRTMREKPLRRRTG